MLRIADCVRPVIPQPTEWQRIGNQIDAALVFARTDFVTCGALNIVNICGVCPTSCHTLYFLSSFLAILSLKRGGGGNRTRE
jgi:hypothetical protein